MAVGRETQVMRAEEETLHTPLLSLGRSCTLILRIMARSEKQG